MCGTFFCWRLERLPWVGEDQVLKDLSACCRGLVDVVADPVVVAAGEDGLPERRMEGQHISQDMSGRLLSVTPYLEIDTWRSWGWSVP